jgi:hypothetical protein
MFFLHHAVVIEKLTPSIFSKIATTPPPTTSATTASAKLQSFKFFTPIVLLSLKNLRHQYFLK